MLTATATPASPATPVVHNSEAAWLEARRNFITATDAAPILGASPWVSPFALYAKKLGLVPDSATSEVMRLGQRLEPVVADCYAEETGRSLVVPPSHTLFVSSTRPWQATSLDRLIEPHPDTGRLSWGVLEIKTTSAFKAGDWENGVPLHYMAQVQHELAVMGYEWASVAVLIGGQKFLWLDVERDDDFIARLIEAEAEFYNRLIAQDPPPVDGSDAAREALAALYRREQAGVTVALPPDADDLDLRLQACQREIKRQQELAQLYQNQIKALIGTAEVGTLPNGVSYQWKTVAKKSYTVAASETRVLRRRGGAE